MWTHAGAALEGESGQTSLHGHYKNVFSTVFLAHVTLGLVQMIIGSTDKAALHFFAIGITVSSQDAVFQRNWHHSQSTGFLLHLAQVPVGISIRSTNWTLRIFLRITVCTAVVSGGLEFRAWTNVSQLNSASDRKEQKKLKI